MIRFEEGLLLLLIFLVLCRLVVHYEHYLSEETITVVAKERKVVPLNTNGAFTYLNLVYTDDEVYNARQFYQHMEIGLCYTVQVRGVGAPERGVYRYIEGVRECSYE